MVLKRLKSGPEGAGDGSNKGSIRRVCSFEDVQREAKLLGLDDSAGAISYLLKVFAGLGAVSWFPEIDKSLVVLNPQWLIDSMAVLIREHEGHHSELLDYLKQDKRAMKLFKEANVRQGIFPVTLLEYIWSSNKKEYKALNGQPQDIKALERILEKFGLICRVQMPGYGPNSVQECYVVPALLTDPPSDRHPDARILDLSQFHPKAQRCACRWDFSESGFLSDYVFERLACAIVSSSSVAGRSEVVLARRVADIRCGDAVILLRLYQKRLCIEAQTVNYDACPHASRWMLKLVQQELDKILQGFMKESYTVFVATSKDDVELSKLRSANKMVFTTTCRSLKAAPLKDTWLHDSHDCECDCCLKVVPQNIAGRQQAPTLEQKPTPSTLIPAPISKPTLVHAPLKAPQVRVGWGIR